MDSLPWWSPVEMREASQSERFHDRGLLLTLAGPMAEQIFGSGEDDPVRRAAIHESGHAVLGWALGRGIVDVLVRPDGSGAATMAPIGVSTAAAATCECARSGGDRAQRLPSDGRNAVAVAWLLAAVREKGRAYARELLRVRRHEARIHVNQHAALILAVAEELLKAGRLDGLQVETIIHRARLEKRSRDLSRV